MELEDINKIAGEIAKDAKDRAAKRAYEKAAFASKIRLMKDETDILKEIAKLLFSINQQLSK